MCTEVRWWCRGRQYQHMRLSGESAEALACAICAHSVLLDRRCTALLEQFKMI